MTATNAEAMPDHLWWLTPMRGVVTLAPGLAALFGPARTTSVHWAPARPELAALLAG